MMSEDHSPHPVGKSIKGISNNPTYKRYLAVAYFIWNVKGLLIHLGQ